jgi:hypothetical protein
MPSHSATSLAVPSPCHCPHTFLAALVAAAAWLLQDYLPDMAFEGVVSPGTDAGADKPVPAAVPATAAARKNV